MGILRLTRRAMHTSSMAEKRHVKIAVVGLGACGLTALKNLREVGFEATGFESSSYIGGLWEYSDDPNKTSVLTTTMANLSKRLGCYTDFPYPDDTPDFPTAAQVADYLNDYADHFQLREHIELNTEILHVSRTDSNAWKLKVQQNGEDPNWVHFDKVVLSTGLQVQTPKVPKIPGSETFLGTAIHSNAYKRASDFHGKRVVVVGFGNTGPDTAVDLIGHASAIYLSHRRGNAILTRWNAKGKPFDHMMSLRLTKIGGQFNKLFPWLSQKASILGLKSVQKKAFAIKPEWNLGQIELPMRKVPTMSEGLVPALHSGDIKLKPGLQQIEGSTLVFADGTILEDVDAIIFCTGFKSDYSFMDPEVNPTRETRKDWSALPGADGRPLPRLYQGIFSLDHPDSLAFLGTSPLTPQACLNYDISSSAVAQVWTGNSQLPSREDMNAHVDAHHELICEIARTGELANTNYRNNWEWYKWCDAAAGIGLVKRMGYGIEGWKFWLADRKLCGLVMDGIMSPHLFRLFDEGKRKSWTAAREQIEKVNREAGRL